MSVFDESSTTGTGEDQTKLEGTQTTTSEDYVSLVAGEKGEQWKDPNVLAKGYVNAQKRIKELEAHATEVSKQNYAKELLAKLQEKQTPPVQGNPEVSKEEHTADKGNTTLTAEDLESLVESTLTKRERENTSKQNVDLVNKTLTDKFGTEAAKHVKSKARELGMSLDKLQEIAGESPTAFLTLLGEPMPKETNSLPRDKANLSSMMSSTPSGQKGSAYYSKLRKDNPRLYRSPQVQNEMLENRRLLGDKYYQT